MKSLAPQALDVTNVELAGLRGDRTACLKVESGHARLGKTYRGKEHELLHTMHQSAQAIASASARGVVVRTETGDPKRYFDLAPVSILFDIWVAEVERALEMPLHPQRWRPNFYVHAARDFHAREAELVGTRITLGEAVLRVCLPIDRCVTPSYDLRTGVSNPDVLGFVARERANVMGIYCEVERAGTVRVADCLRLER